ncbi:MAG: cephalosporin hydroxylase [Castellaniella sp.]|uniref:cephalosporin hydroxylase family protein n=1 Tax=Castellaniella sp. TaxID=1955812 RepID=UPI0011F8317E|nr:cephalosporin hydroxylase family protein [Castellaniella sp.]TAN26609.1 MAG: cephalosporin hydroxylase [Castellaniella sp.]
MSKDIQFEKECIAEIAAMSADEQLREKTREWITRANAKKYSYHFDWLGRPIIQYPQDIVAMQELIWTVKPDLIIETGIARGGSLMFSASMLALLDIEDAASHASIMDPRKSKRKVLGLDIDIRAHNRDAIERHPFFSYIQMIEGSSIDQAVVAKVREVAAGHKRILVCLDSNHTHAHVLAELKAYAPLVSPASYCVVFDTIIEDMEPDAFPDRPWGQGNNPKTAVKEYLAHHAEFRIDDSIQNKLQITVAPDGYLKRIG